MTGLRLGHTLKVLRPTLTNGPGWRVSLWVQGCSLRCTTDCLNPHLLEAAGGHMATVEDVMKQILTVQKQRSELEGISVLGGEPLDQAGALACLFEQVRQSGLSTMLYTGYTLEAIRTKHREDMDRLLCFTDILVDGPFLPQAYSGTLAWRGSRNQRLICLSERYTPDALSSTYERQRKAYSIQISPTGLISVSGLQIRSGAESIEKMLSGSQL